MTKKCYFFPTIWSTTKYVCDTPSRDTLKPSWTWFNGCNKSQFGSGAYINRTSEFLKNPSNSLINYKGIYKEIWQKIAIFFQLHWSTTKYVDDTPSRDTLKPSWTWCNGRIKSQFGSGACINRTLEFDRISTKSHKFLNRL